jgi:catechol 2,3-dioxygenase-like lactoylglutathione lyase family enzyme
LGEPELPEVEENAAEARMVKTHGLTHIALKVRDPERSLRFYEQLFGVREYFRDAESIQAQGPGSHDVLAFELDPAGAGASGGIAHFGFRLTDPADIELAIREAERAGGKLLRRGEFSPGYPFAYVADPDGYEIEIWFE